MAVLDLEALGMTQEELQERVVNRICEQALVELKRDEDDDEYHGGSGFAVKLDRRINDLVDQSIEDIANKHILPNVAEYIEKVTLQRTNEWGEKTGKATTFVEYLVAQAEKWLTENVDYEGKDRRESRDSSFRADGTRVAYMVDKHLQYSIGSAMDKALKTVNAQIADGIAETVKLQLTQICEKLKPQVTLK